MRGTHRARHPKPAPPERNAAADTGLSARTRPMRTTATAAPRRTSPRIATKSEIASRRAGSEKRAIRPAAGRSGSRTDSALRRNTIGANIAVNDETIRRVAPTLPTGAARCSHGLVAGSGGCFADNATPVALPGTVSVSLRFSAVIRGPARPGDDLQLRRRALTTKSAVRRAIAMIVIIGFTPGGVG